jgi:ATP-dependent protease Clp ATPase subunit
MTDLMFDMPSEKENKEVCVSKAYTEEKFGKSKYGKLKVA